MALIAGISGWFFAQLIKLFINIITKQDRKLNLKEIVFGSGGMPSSHTATVCALTTYICLTDGFFSSISSLALIFSFIVMYDAMNVRQETGKQGKYLNDLRVILQNLYSDIPLETKFKEFVGHTPLQVFIGCLLGIIIGTVIYFLSDIRFFKYFVMLLNSY